MIIVEEINTYGWKTAIRGMRNPKNSWNRMDSNIDEFGEGELGQYDLKLMKNLFKAGSEHAKYLRFIHVSFDVTAPLYWWKEFDTYKVGTSRNSCSTMHEIHVKPFGVDMFSHDAIVEASDKLGFLPHGRTVEESFELYLNTLEQLRKAFNETQNKVFWRAMIQMMPEGYNMKATWDGSLQTVSNVLAQRYFIKHKLDEWHTFGDALLEGIPHIKNIIGIEE